MHYNWYVLFLTALIPLVTGFIWYHPAVAGKAWMGASEMTEEKIKSGNMPMIFGLTYVLGLLFSLGLAMMVIHQSHVMSLLVNEEGFGQEGSPVMQYFNDFMGKYGHNFRTFRHGVFHGLFGGLLIVTPALAVTALFERRSFRYMAIHCLYWMLTMALMGGSICAWL